MHITRRESLGLMTLVPAISLEAHASAHGFSSDLGNRGYLIERLSEEGIEMHAVNGGEGTIHMRYFGLGGHNEPNIFLNYLIPPGSSEGVHTHRLGDAQAGSFDEIYIIKSGQGVMMINGKAVAVVKGDHVLTPNGVPHGIRNDSADKPLDLLLIAIKR